MPGLTLATIGLDEHDSVLVRTALELASGIEIAQWRVIKDTELANAILVNVDSSEGRGLVADLAYLSTYWETANHPILVRCSQADPVAQNGDFNLATPLVYATLIELLKKLQSQLDVWKQPEDVPLLYTSLAQTAGDPVNEHAPRPEDPYTESKPANAPEAAQRTLEQSVSKGIAKQFFLERTDVADVPDELPREDIAELVNIQQTSPHSGKQVARDQLDEMEGPETKLEPNVVPVRGELRWIDMKVQTNDKPLHSTVLLSEESFRARTRPARQFHTNMRFLGLLVDTLSKGRSVVISHAVFPPVRVLPQQALFQSSPDTVSNADLFRAPAAQFNIVPWFRATGKKAQRKHMKLPLWILLYCASLFGSEGRLRQGVNPYSEMHLREAPDFRVLPHEKDHLKIAGFMLENIADLETIASATGVPIETVIEFTNACDELLLIDRYFNDLAADDKYRTGRENKYWKRLYSEMPGQSKAVKHSFLAYMIPRWVSGKR